MKSILEIKTIFILHSQGCHYIEIDAYYMGIKAFDHLPSYIKKLSEDKNQFKNTLKSYLLLNSFYSLNYFLIVNINFYFYVYK
jgi:hypothetical protein